jgi:hypothetical protein
VNLEETIAVAIGIVVGIVFLAFTLLVLIAGFNTPL